MFIEVEGIVFRVIVFILKVRILGKVEIEVFWVFWLVGRGKLMCLREKNLFI